MPRFGNSLDSSNAQCEPSQDPHVVISNRRRRRILIPLLVALVVVLQLPLVGIPRTLADVLFSYDNAGQLSQVTDQNGYNASYSHDSSDNLLSIGGNVPTKETEVWLITPSAGATRTQVTIFGANFSATPSADAVAFGGVAATVSTASASQLTVVVPSGAQSGVVTVTTSNGKGQSPGPFTVE